MLRLSDDYYWSLAKLLLDIEETQEIFMHTNVRVCEGEETFMKFFKRF